MGRFAMPVTFILGRAGTGKTHRCLADILAALETERDGAPLLWIVPEQATFQLERTLALRSPRNGYWRAEVLSFSRLARRLFTEIGREPPTIRPTARTLALRALGGQNPAYLRPFGAAATTPGFFTRLDRLIEELLRENISPDDLAAGAAKVDNPTARARFEALSRIFAAYLDWLGPERVDPAQWLGALRAQLPRIDWLSGARVWVDGFAGLTGQELETLVTLAGVVRRMHIALLLDPDTPNVSADSLAPDRLGLFSRTETTYHHLCKRLAEVGVAITPPIRLRPDPPPRFANAPTLARLEAGLAGDSFGASVLRRAADEPHAPAAANRDPEPTQSSPEAAPQVEVLVCETHRDELRAAAQTIRRLVIESGGDWRFRDFALIARDLTPLADDIADVFAEYEIPFFLDRRRALDGHVLSRFVPGLIRVVQADFATTETIRLLRCGLLPATRDQAERLENLLLAEELHGWELWRRGWASGNNAAPVEPARRRIVAALEPFVEFVRATATPTGETWAVQLYELFERLGLPDVVARWIDQARKDAEWETAEYHRLAWDTLCTLLEDLHAVMADAPLSGTDLATIIEGGLRDLTVGLAPPTLDQVLISSIERSRHPDIRLAWVLAMNEGVFPAPPTEDVLLGTEDREELARTGLVALRPRRDDVFAERMLAYIALTRPSRRLIVSYARVGASGEPAYPSPLLRDLRRVLGPIAEPHPLSGDTPPTSCEEFASKYVEARRQQRENRRRWRRYRALRDLLRGSPACDAAVDRLLRAERYDNLPPTIADYARDETLPASVAWSGSPSQLETYLLCPFRHFARYGLRLQAQRTPVAAQEMGIEAHAVLAEVVNRALDDGRAPNQIDDAQWLTWLDQAFAQRTQQQPADFARRRPQAAFLGQAQRRFLRDVVLAQAHRWRRGAFGPLACERAFRIDDADDTNDLHAYELPLPDGRNLRISGIIDRLDVCTHDGHRYLLVCDYKSTARKLRKTPLTGDRLQLLAYLLATQQAFTTDEPAHAAGVLLLPLYPAVGVLNQNYAKNADENTLRMYLYRPRGLFTIDIAGLLDIGLDEKQSPVAAMHLKKNGDMHPQSDARPLAELTAYLDLARRTIQLAGEGLAAGRIEIAPLIENKTLACQTCDYKPLCRFEPLWNRARRADVTLPSLEEDGDAA